MPKCLIALLTLFPAAALAATVWTWVDEQGRRHYSDTEVPGATPLEVGESQTFSGAESTSARAVTPQPDGAAAATEAASYTTLDVVSPETGETLWNIEGNLTVELATYPALAAGHRIDVILDGTRKQLDARALALTVPEVWRGEHTLQAVIVNAEDEVLIRSDSITVYVRQTSVLN